MENKRFKITKHIIILIITSIIFSSGFLLSNFLLDKKVMEITGLQDNLRIDILALETQFAVLEQAPCTNLDESTLTDELFKISQRLVSLEGSLGDDHEAYTRLKKFYTLLQIKHWLLFKETNKDCNLNLVSVAYFYSNNDECQRCGDQGEILTYFRKKYPFLRIYAFDYELDLSALETIKSVYQLEEHFPILIVNDEVEYGFKNKDDMIIMLDSYLPEDSTSSTSTINIQ